MAKTKSKWVCQNCGYETASYLGRCPECNQFGVFVEEITKSDTTKSPMHIKYIGLFIYQSSSYYFVFDITMLRLIDSTASAMVL
jgi:predicted ATP-dependent serine protease